MQLVKHINEIYLIRLRDLGLNDGAEPVIELLHQESVAFFVDIFQNALICFFVGDSVSVERFQILFMLLIHRLLVEHEKSSIPVSGAHDSRPLVQFGRKEPFTVGSSWFLEVATPGRIQKRELAAIHIAHIVITC